MSFLSQTLKYVSPSTIKYNPVKAFSYILAYPLVIFFKRCKATPNFVSFLSFLFAVAAFASLLYSSLHLYLFCWFCSYILDFSDGTLARMISNVRMTSLRVDHYSDIIKFTILFFGFFLFFDSQLLDILSFFSATSYLFYTIVNHDTNYSKKLLKTDLITSNSISLGYTSYLSPLSKLKYYMNKNPLLSRPIHIFLTTFTTLDGQIMIIFFFIPINSVFASVLMVYFISLAFIQSICRLLTLSCTPRVP